MMVRKSTWCAMRNIIKGSNFMKPHCLLRVHKRVEFTHSPYDDPLGPPLNSDYGEVKSYKQFLNETKTCANVAISALMKTLDVTKENATKVVNNWRIFSTLSMLTIMKNDDLLREAGAQKSTLRENMYALADTTLNVQTKIKALKFIDVEINDAMPLFQLPVRKLNLLESTTRVDRTHLDYRNRIAYLSDALNCNTFKLCVALCNASYMLNVPVIKLVTVTKYLLETGISKEHIIKDLLIYRYSIPKIEERCALAKQAGILKLRPWVVRCPESVIEKYGTRLDIRRNVFGPSGNVADYISRMLDCNVESVKALLRRDPSIESIAAKRLSSMLNLLRDYGYTIQDVYRMPRALHSDPETVTKRYNIWMQQSVEIPPLFVLAQSENIFNKRLRRTVKKIE